MRRKKTKSFDAIDTEEEDDDVSDIKEDDLVDERFYVIREYLEAEELLHDLQSLVEKVRKIVRTFNVHH